MVNSSKFFKANLSQPHPLAAKARMDYGFGATKIAVCGGLAIFV